MQAMVALPDQPPLFFIWLGVGRKVKYADGPERVFGEWWKIPVVSGSGSTGWVGQHGETGPQGRFLHGIFG